MTLLAVLLCAALLLPACEGDGALLTLATLPPVPTPSPEEERAIEEHAPPTGVELLRRDLAELEVALAARDDQIRMLEEALAARDAVLAEHRSALARLEEAFAEHCRAADELMGQLEAAGLAGRNASGLVATVARLEADLRALEGIGEELQRTSAAHADRLQALGGAISELDGELASGLAKLERRRAEVAGRLSSAVDAVAGRLERLRTVVEALRAVSPIPNIERDVPEIDGHILSIVEGPGGPVLLLSVGAEAGVRPGYELRVHAGEEVVAKVRVLETAGAFSSAMIVLRLGAERVRPGMPVTTRT